VSHRFCSNKTYSAENALTGKVPTELGSLQRLSFCDLGMFACYSVSVLARWEVLLSRKIPSSDMSRLFCTINRTAFNILTATIPPDFGNMTALDFLQLGTVLSDACAALTELLY
jgi:hypothetical protein